MIDVARSPDASGQTRARLGVYYFDGWASDLSNFHFKGLYPGPYAERQPLSGWQDNTACAMSQQLAWARSYGINFFVFLYYYRPDRIPGDPGLNTALRLYRQLADHHGVGYALLSVNDQLFGPPADEWQIAVDEWAEMFADPDYVRVDGRPLFMVISTYQLEQTFGSTKVTGALDALRAASRSRGQPPAFVIGGYDPPYGSYGKDDQVGDLTPLAREGFDALSVYGYGFVRPAVDGPVPYGDLVASGKWTWEQTARKSSLPYIPVVVDGLDPRPWQVREPITNRLMWYERSPEEFASFVGDAITWAELHPRARLEAAPTPPIVLVEAWNELGEGSYLVPTIGEGHRYGDALARVLLEPSARVRSVLALDIVSSSGRRVAAGTLREANGHAIGGAAISLLATPLDGAGVVSEYSGTGTVPAGAGQAVVGFRVNTEGAGPMPSAFSLYEVDYREGGGSQRVPNADFATRGTWAIQGAAKLAPSDRDAGQMVRVDAASGQEARLDSQHFAVTPGSSYTVTFTARVAPSALGSGYFMLIFLELTEIPRISLPLSAATVDLGHVVTMSDGTFRVDIETVGSDRLLLEATYPGDPGHWPAVARIAR